MGRSEDTIKERDELFNNKWINLVGDSKGFEGDTEKDKDLLVSLVGKSSFAWTEEDELVKEADKHGYGVNLIVFDKAEWKENYQRDRGIRTKNRTRNLKLRRKAA
ncbi:MAG: hypothetical protein E3J71_09470 [Candidatus Stahlbacteria bacterium]|nr:MAG: hypothetical protein E3J71_09470 [Candidatus Stahlbacteria bacterium]